MYEGEFSFNFPELELVINDRFIGMMVEGACRIHWTAGDGMDGWEMTGEAWLHEPRHEKLSRRVIIECNFGPITDAMMAVIKHNLEHDDALNKRLMHAINDDMAENGCFARTDAQEHGLGVNQMI